MDTDAHELTLTKSSVKRLVKDETGDRVTGDAIRRVMLIEERRMRRLARAAKAVKDESGRATIQEGDVLTAERLLEGEI